MHPAETSKENMHGSGSSHFSEEEKKKKICGRAPPLNLWLVVVGQKGYDFPSVVPPIGLRS